MITVLGSTGFIGSNLLSKLNSFGVNYFAPNRNDDILGRNLGDIIYCIGMTADFRNKPFETAEAHICKLKFVLEKCAFTSLIYLSSTRVYFGNKVMGRKLNENDSLIINPNNANDLFASTKITGELLSLNSKRTNIKIVRLSNVYGNDFYSENFITSIIKDGIIKNKIILRTTPDSAKDYISINDVCEALILLSKTKSEGIYNLNSGFNTTNEEILNEIKRITGSEIVYSEGAEKIVFQEIDNNKINSIIPFKLTSKITDDLESLVVSFKSKIK